MTEAERIYEKFSPFIKEAIYKNGWKSLRDIQISAAKTIFETDNNLLIRSPTASGKTEAAFFPVISEIYRDNPIGISVLYIAPLKSLINDQFDRINILLEESGIPVTHWHGDVSASHKNRMLDNPKGVLQITPESLESMLINRSNDILRIFCNLRYVIIDEIHIMLGTDRGNQIMCQLSRIAHYIGYSPRRIGLSATIGDPEQAILWLTGDSGRKTDCPDYDTGKIKWRLGLEHFYVQNAEQTTDSSTRDPERAAIDAGYEYMYECVKDKKSLVFSNSREETEYITATFRQIAHKKNERDVFLIHHGNLSASLREEAEIKMKKEEEQAVTCATVTMELGIDIGRLERILQNESPNSVSSFLQRLGRSGRRGQPPEMMMVFREEDPLPNTPLPQLIPWNLIRAIAIIQLYIEERFIEPPQVKKMPYSLLFHQTLSVLAASGELTAARLAAKILAMPPFSQISKEDYKTLIVSMINNDYIEMTEEKGLIVGLAGERLIKSFKFYAVFKDSEDYTVRNGSDEIGTITTPPPVGDRFALAGNVWEVDELDIPRKLIYAHQVQGKMSISWPGDYGEIHTKIMERMKKVLCEDTVYPYLKPNARKRLDVARHLAANTGITRRSLIHIGGYTWALFPWLGTRSFRTLRKFISVNAADVKVSNLEFEGCCYMTFRLESGNDYLFVKTLADKILSRNGIVCSELVSEKEAPIFEKYDNCIPAELLRKAYATDKLRADEAEKRIFDILKEY